jgi:hypothetical protein
MVSERKRILAYNFDLTGDLDTEIATKIENEKPAVETEKEITGNSEMAIPLSNGNVANSRREGSSADGINKSRNEERSK